MSKYDIDQIRATMLARWRNQPPRKFCKFDGTRDLVKSAGRVEAEEGIDIPNAPTMFKLWIEPKTSFGIWEHDLVCRYDATNMLISVEPDYHGPDQVYELAWYLQDEFGDGWDGFLEHLHFSQNDLALIEAAVRRYVTGE